MTWKRKEERPVFRTPGADERRFFETWGPAVEQSQETCVQDFGGKI